MKPKIQVETTMYDSRGHDIRLYDGTGITAGQVESISINIYIKHSLDETYLIKYEITTDIPPPAMTCDFVDGVFESIEFYRINELREYHLLGRQANWISKEGK